MATKNMDLVKPLQIKLDQWSDRQLREDASEKTVTLSTLVRQIVREHYKQRTKSRKGR